MSDITSDHVRFEEPCRAAAKVDAEDRDAVEARRRRAATLLAAASLAILPLIAAQSTDSRQKPSETGPPQARSLPGRPLQAMPASEERGKLEAELAEARAALVERPDDRERLIWVGRRLGYLWGYREAVDIFSRGIERFPEHAAFYRHRGHRWISLREFDKAIVDLEKAAELIRGKPDQIEPDGRPNGENKPLTTLGFNVSYHLPLAHYLKGDFERSLPAWRESMNHLGGHDDNLVAVTDWLYMTLRRLGRDEEAARLLEPIKPEMHIIANHAYHRRCLMYKGLPEPAQVLDVSQASDLDLATLGYGMGNWHFYIGRRDEAVKVWKRVVAGPHWPAFGFVAAEAELARLKER